MADPMQVVRMNSTGYVVVCGSAGARLMDTREGRSWRLGAGSLVDPDAGWSIDMRPLTTEPRSDASHRCGPLPMTRHGRWVVSGTRPGVSSFVLLTPRGQPLP